MAHGTTHHGQISTAPEPKDPTGKNLPKSTITSSCNATTKTSHPTTQSLDPLIPSKKALFMTNKFSRLSLNHKTLLTPQKPTSNQQNHPLPCRDIHLQAKAMTVSADASWFSLRPAKESLKEKVRKASKDLDKKKEQQQHKKSVLDSKQIANLTVKEKQVMKNLHEGYHHDMNNIASTAAAASLGRRRSFCGSQVELADVLASCGVKIVSFDMPPFMQIHAVDCARKTHDSLEKFSSKTLAHILKKEFDGVYGPAWHCIVGTSFGSFVTHSVCGFLYFSMDQKLHVLLFKTTVQRAD